MEATRVDLILNGQKSVFRDGVVDIELKDHGRWKINDISGKVLCRIAIKIPRKGVTVDFIPSHPFCEELIDKMLEAEHANDTFIFENPVIDDMRPLQLETKLQSLLKIIDKWKPRRTNHRGEPGEIMVEPTSPKPTHPCHTCKSSDWWWQPDSQWGPGGWLCGTCHPNPNKEAEMSAKVTTQVSNKAPSKTQAHIQYKLKDGSLVPGVTTILSILNKPALIEWAYQCGRKDLDYREVRDNAADIGTLAHYLIMCHLKGEAPDTSQYSPLDIQKANNCLAKFQNWLKERPVSSVMIEAPLVSEEFRYGGTLDLFAELNGEFTLVDFKTGKAVYVEMLYQLAAYQKLLEEQGWPVTNARILRIGTDEDEGFEEKIRTSLDNEWQIFTHCLEIYRLQKAG